MGKMAHEVTGSQRQSVSLIPSSQIKKVRRGSMCLLSLVLQKQRHENPWNSQAGQHNRNQ